jgi:hypothetical protein
MALQVCNGATLKCSMGVAPSTLVVLAPVLNNTSKLVCMMGGMIEAMMPGQATHMIP